MITLYTGTPGSGKSYISAEMIDRALRRGIPVIANFEINVNPKKHKGEFIYIETLELNPEFFTGRCERRRNRVPRKDRRRESRI